MKTTIRYKGNKEQAWKDFKRWFKGKRLKDISNYLWAAYYATNSLSKKKSAIRNFYCLCGFGGAEGYPVRVAVRKILGQK
jgi:hypothetical protein